jgi:putative ABC transport system permease protein
MEPPDMRLTTMAVTNLARRPLRSILTILGIATAVAAFVSLVGLSRGLELSWSRSLQARGTHLLAIQKGAVELLTTSLDAGLAAELERIEGVESAAGELGNMMILENNFACVAMGWTRDSHLWGTLRLLSGRLPSPSENRAVLLGEAAAETLHKRPGDLLKVQDETFTITGLFRLNGVMGNSSVVLPLDVMQELMGRPGKVTGFHVRVKHPEAPNGITAVQARLQSTFPRLSFLETGAAADNDQIMKLFRSVAWSVSAIAMVIALVVLLNTLLMAVLERTREIGVLSAVGWPARRILSLFVLEGMLTACIGGAVGVALGAGGRQWLTRLPRLRGFIEPDVTGTLLGTVVAASILLGIMGSLYPAWRAVRLDPVEALQYE